MDGLGAKNVGEIPVVTIEEEKALEFANRLKSEIRGEIKVDDPTEMDDLAAFVEVAAGYIVQDGGAPEFLSAPFDDRVGKQKAAVFGYSPVDEQGVLRLFTGDYAPDETSRTLGKSDFEKLVRRAAHFFKCVLDDSGFDPSGEATECVEHIRDNLDRIEEIRIIVVSDRRIAADELEAELNGIKFRSETYDIDRLYRISDITIRRSDIIIDFQTMPCGAVPCLEVSGRDYNYKTYLLMLDGETVYRISERYGARLYELNLRSYLQPKTPVNKGILGTIRETPERFLAYNNGLCATADEIEAGTENGQSVIRRLVGFQIVNGAQTTSSIHRARKLGHSLSRVHVAVKLTRVDADDLDEFVPLITEYANTQNPIRASDLRSNLEFHRMIEDLSERIWAPDGRSRWFYERARGSYEAALARFGTTPKKKKEFKAECPKSQVFKKEELAIHWVCWNGQPDIAARGAQRNFNTFMKTVGGLVAQGFRPDGNFYRDSVAKVIVAKAAERAIRRASVTAYKAQVRCYLVSMLRERFGDEFRLDRVWREQAVSDELNRLLEAWAPVIRDAIVQSANERGKNVTEWCKKTDCWSIVRELELPIQTGIPETISPLDESLFDLPEDEAPPVQHRENDSQEYDGPETANAEDVELCMRLAEQDWNTIATWGARDRILDEFERKIVATMLNMSIGGWRKPPTAKQAKHAARIARLAISREVIPPRP